MKSDFLLGASLTARDGPLGISLLKFLEKPFKALTVTSRSITTIATKKTSH